MQITPNMLKKLALSSLKHREVIETQILPLSPEDIAPKVNAIIELSKRNIQKSQRFYVLKRIVPPQNIFELE